MIYYLHMSIYHWRAIDSCAIDMWYDPKVGDFRK